MKLTHTPAPWILDGQAIFVHTAPSGSSPTPGQLICRIIGDSAEAEANSLLIENAPNLLQACLLALSVLQPGTIPHRDIQRIVNRALGRPDLESEDASVYRWSYTALPEDPQPEAV